jgi:hypothetical protein
VDTNEANAALEQARAALQAVRAKRDAAAAAGDYDAAMHAVCDVIAADRRVMAAQVDVDLAAPPRLHA